MEEELAQKTRELETLYDLSLLINQSLDIDTVFHTALEKALSVTGFEMGAIYLLNEKGDILERKSDIGLTPTIFEDGKVLKYGEGVSGNAIRLKQPVIVSIDKYSSYRKVPVLIEEGIQTLVGFPLQAKGKIVGTITLLSHSPRELSKREINLLESIGYQIGIALEKLNLLWLPNQNGDDF
jgi:GAF domain-containing protein